MQNIITLWLCFLLVLGNTTTLFSQFEEHTWFFGGGNLDRPGILFDQNTNVPAPYNNVRFGLNLTENNILVASPNTGTVQFYSDGERVVDGTHQVMPNGDNLSGTPSTMYGTAVVLDPSGCGERFLLFYGEDETASPPRQLFYSTVDMSMPGNGTVAAPLGDIVDATKNTNITPPGVNVGEGLFALPKSANSRESWLFFCDRNARSLYILNIAATGISIHQSYSLPLLFDNFPADDLFSIRLAFIPIDDTLGYLVLAPGRSQNMNFPIGYALFNKTSGTLNIGSLVEIFTQASWTYGLEISPDSSKIYFSDYFNKTLHQYDLATSTLTQVGISNHNGRTGGLKVGPDGRLYWAHQFNLFNNASVSSLSIVNAPNALGNACDLQIGAWDIGQTPLRIGALPSFGALPPPSEVEQTLAVSCDTPFGSATITQTTGIAPFSYLWDNGETTITASDLLPGPHTVVITDATGCQEVLTVTIEDISDLDLSDAMVATTNPMECNAPTGSLHISSVPLIPNSSYVVSYEVNGMVVGPLELLTDSDGNLVINGLNDGEYTNLSIQVPGNPNCSGILTGPYTLIAPGTPATPMIEWASGFCLGDTLRLSGFGDPGVSLEWTGPNNFSVSGPELVFPNADASLEGTYTLVATLNNCSSIAATIDVFFDIPPATSLIDTVSCAAALVLEVPEGLTDLAMVDRRYDSNSYSQRKRPGLPDGVQPLTGCAFQDSSHSHLWDLYPDLNYPGGLDLEFGTNFTLSPPVWCRRLDVRMEPR
jgi:hypothetical protein